MNRHAWQLLLMALPAAVFALGTYLEFGRVPPVALGFTLAAFALLSAWFLHAMRRDTLAGMRREGMIDEDYEPPAF